MKLQNIFALIVTLIGFAACTSESELLDTAVNDDLVPVTISLGSIQTKASVDLGTDEGTVQNAVIGIFDSKGIPTITPIVLESGNGRLIRIPLVKSNAYAFVNVSEADIAALKNISSMNEFKNYAITKQLTQVAAALPKFGEKTNFTPAANGNIEIPVKQLTARLDVNVSVELTENGQPVTGVDFVPTNLEWSGIAAESATTKGNDGRFTTNIKGMDYNQVINRTYSYPGVKPTLSLQGVIGEDGESKSYTYTFKDALEKDNVYLLNVIVKGELSDPVTVTFEYQLVDMGNVSVDVPDFN